MRDFYLCSPSRDALVVDLALVGLAVAGEIVTASPSHALHYVGEIVGTPGVVDAEGNQVTPPEVLPGVYAALRCMDTTLAETVATAEFVNGTTLVDAPAGAPVWL